MYHHHNQNNKHICYLQKIPCVLCFVLFLMWISVARTHHRIYPLKLLGAQRISTTYSLCKAEVLYSLNSNSPFPIPHLLAPHSVFCFYKSDYFRYFMEVKSCSMCPPLTDFCDYFSDYNVFQVHLCCHRW